MRDVDFVVIAIAVGSAFTALAAGVAKLFGWIG
jgi:hypothetical protein